MMPDPGTGPAADPRRVFAFNGGFFTQKRLRRIMALAGYPIRAGMPGPEDLVAIWGNSPTAHRGRAVAQRRDVGLLRVEDAFLRSVKPGRSGSPPLGLLLDRRGVHFDPETPSDLETLLTTHPLDDTALLQRARDGITRLRAAHLSKYNIHDPDTPPPDPGYVLVVDQTFGDASVTASRADRNRFREMLVFAQQEHPGAPILLKTHPETRAGHRQGYFQDGDLRPGISFYAGDASPWDLLDGAIAVYSVSSQLGFEAILAGHKPRIFGHPFYAGWGLTQDETPPRRRHRKLTRAQLFAAAMILAPTWYDPVRGSLCSFETAVDILEAETRAWRADRHGWVASGMRLWKRRPLQKVFGQEKPVLYREDQTLTGGRRHMIWASKATDPESLSVRVEDGFLRSRGLGAELVPPLSLVTDRTGIYYDPSRPCDLEHLIAERADLREDQRRRAETLRKAILAAGLSKYNLGGAAPDLPEGHRILVPGQVEDDASILKGAGKVRTNLDLLRAARTAHPDAVILYKPHPDVEAGLRDGKVAMAEALKLADQVLIHGDPVRLLDQVQEVWTMTSLLGFEALIRDVPVTTLGAPFYAG